MYNAGSLISQIHKLTDRKINQLLKINKIKEFNCAQGSIIYALWPDKKLSIKEISKITCLAMSSLTTMLQRMEEKGLIETKLNPQDKRSTLICLKDKARKATASFEKISCQMFDVYYQDFSKDEIILFENMLQKVLKNLEETK